MSDVRVLFYDEGGEPQAYNALYESQLGIPLQASVQKHTKQHSPAAAMRGAERHSDVRVSAISIQDIEIGNHA